MYVINDIYTIQFVVALVCLIVAMALDNNTKLAFSYFIFVFH